MDRVVVVGASAGGVSALQRLLAALDPSLGVPVVIVLHSRDARVDPLVHVLSMTSALPVREALAGERARDGVAYLAPGGYHLLLERGGGFSLSMDEKVCYARPSIDVLFTSAADACGSTATGVLLTGSNEDGARGLVEIRRRGGMAYVQDPTEAEAPQMPEAALRLSAADTVLPLAGLAALINQRYAT